MYYTYSFLWRCWSTELRLTKISSTKKLVGWRCLHEKHLDTVFCHIPDTKLNGENKLNVGLITPQYRMNEGQVLA